MSDPAQPPAPVRVFCSYSHQDEDGLQALNAHLAEVRRQGLIAAWNDRCIRPGEDWSRAIDDALNQADLTLLLVTKDFLNSDYCSGIELARALERARAGETRVIPVYLRPAYWKGAPFARFQGTPKDAKPVFGARDRDAAWVEVVEAIVLAAREVRGQEAPRRGLLVRSPGLERGFRPSWPAVALGVLLAAGLGLALWWWWPQDPALIQRLAAGWSDLDRGRYAQALQEYRAALEIAPQDDRALLGREKAETFAEPGPKLDVEETQQRLLALAAAHPRDPHVRMMLGRLATTGGERKEARRRYLEALELDSRVAQAEYELGVLDQEDDRLEDAAAHYRRALELAPRHRRYLTNLAGLLLEQGDTEAAMAFYRRVIGDAPDLLLPRLDAGNLARLMGDLRVASHYHEGLLTQPAPLAGPGAGDNAADWVFPASGGENGTPAEPLVLSTEPAKRAYLLLTVSVTRFLNENPAGALAAAQQAEGLAGLERARGVLHHDLIRLADAQPEYAEPICRYRRGINLLPGC